MEKHLALGMLVVLLTFSSCGPAGYDTWSVDSMTKVNLTDSLPPGSPNPPAANIKLAQCESGSFQIAVRPASGQHLDNVRLELSDLTSPGKTPIAATSNISWQVVGVLKVPNPSPPPDYFYYPDILLPVANFNIATGNTHSMLITTTVPLGQAAGTYTGTVTVKTDSGPDTTVDVTLTVFGFAIPRSNTPGSMHLKTSWTLAHFGTEQQYRDFGDLLLNYRMNPDDIYRNGTPDIATLEDWYQRGLSCFNIYKADALNPAAGDHIQRRNDLDLWLTNQLNPSLHGAELRALAYFYGFDEKARDYCEDNMVPTFNDLKSRWPDIPNMNTSYNINPWADPLGDMDHFSMDRVCVERHYNAFADGELLRHTVDPKLPNNERYQYWEYSIGMSVESPLLAGRRIFWSAYQQKADGLLHYRVNGWTDFPNPAPIDPNNGPIINYTFPAGYTDSVYLYNGITGPLASMRMVSARDGMQEWEYLWAIGHYDTDGATRLGKIASVETAGELAEQIATGWSGDTDPTHLLNARDVIAGWLTQPYVASYPTPEHRSIGVNSNPTLSWQADSGNVNSFDVYFGTDKTAVLNATPASPEFKGNQTATTYSPGALAKSNVKYYWRIDEVVSGVKYKGYVWSFEGGYGLCGWWKFDETSGNTVKDWSVLAHDGTISGTVNHVAGVPDSGKAAGFVHNGYVDIPATSLSTLDRQVTVAFWQYGDPSQPQPEFTFQALTAANETVISGEVPQGNGSLRFAVGTTDACIKAAALYEVRNRWNHWAFTKNADTAVMNVYLNGVPWATATGKTQSVGTAASFRIGAAADGTAGYDGTLDDFRVYDVELSPADILTLYKSYNTIGGQGLVGHWTFDELSGSTVKDDSDYLNDGTIFGATRTPGKIGNALSFNGTTSDYVQIPVNGMTFGRALTISEWTYGDASLPSNNSAGSVAMGAARTDGTTCWETTVPSTTGTIDFVIGGDSGHRSGVAQASQYKGQWNHWVFTCSDGERSLTHVYLNGSLFCGDPNFNYNDIHHIIGIVAGFRIGKGAADEGNVGYVNNPYKGMLDEVRLYNRELSSKEVADLYAADCPNCPVPVIIDHSSLQPPKPCVSQAYSYKIPSTNATTFTVTTGQLPPGLMLDASSGEIHGTPTACGSYSVNVDVVNNGCPWKLEDGVSLTLDVVPMYAVDFQSQLFGSSLGTKFELLCWTFEQLGAQFPVMFVDRVTLPTPGFTGWAGLYFFTGGVEITPFAPMTSVTMAVGHVFAPVTVETYNDTDSSPISTQTINPPINPSDTIVYLTTTNSTPLTRFRLTGGDDKAALVRVSTAP